MEMPYNLEAPIKAKQLTLDNYLSHLDEMTDEEIAFMLNKVWITNLPKIYSVKAQS